MKEALANIRVVELGYEISAQYTSKLLADLGADVIKIEPRGSGDPLRSQGSFPGDPSDPTIGSLFRYLNTNKRSIELDIDDESDIEVLLKIVKDADILIESLGVGELGKYGLSPDKFRSVNPRIALVRISDFGQEGAYADMPSTDLIVQALSGWVSTHYMVGQEPVQGGGHISEFVVGMFSACGALTAYKAAARSGEAVCLDVSKQECLISCIVTPWLHVEQLKALGWNMPEGRHFFPPGITPCKDGWVGINNFSAQNFEDFCRLAGLDEFIDKRMEIVACGDASPKFFKSVETWAKEHTVNEIVEMGQAARIPVAPIANGKQLLEMEQLKARNFFISEPGGKFIQPSFPYRLEATPASLRSPAPKLGGHNSESVSPWRGKKPRAGQAKPLYKNKGHLLPFSGLRIVDFGTYLAGGTVGAYLGSYGADVIKIESIQRPDSYRYAAAYPQEGPDWYEHAGSWQTCNLNKRDITLNIDDPEGRRLAEELITKADVVIENYTPRVMDNLKLGTKRIKELNPDIIFLRMPGFGLEGPWRDYAAFAFPIEQSCGIAWITGWPGQHPSNLGGYVDVMNAMHALVALQAALHHRELTGEGQLIELAQLESLVCTTAEQTIAYSITGRIMDRTGNRDARMAPQGVYRCKNGEYAAISIRNDDEWQRFVSLMGSPSWAQDGKLNSCAGRLGRQDDLDRSIAEWTAGQAADEAVKALRVAGIPATKLVNSTNVLTEPNLVARRFHQVLTHPAFPKRQYPRFPWLQNGKTGYGYGGYRSGAPTLGQHNIEVLSGELGLTKEQIEALAKREVIGNIPKGMVTNTA
ncbi:MAG: CoA transferase [Dehalococcoidia bacterium]|jgi:crotonobetainyl-CoA:carnitine CoA-transferase CaiB-like acyl-CoA transferase